MFAGKKSAQIREILISESAWEEMTCLFAPSVAFLHSEDSYSAIVAQLPEKQEYLYYSDERVMKKLFYVHEDLMPPP